MTGKKALFVFIFALKYEKWQINISFRFTLFRFVALAVSCLIIHASICWTIWCMRGEVGSKCRHCTKIESALRFSQNGIHNLTVTEPVLPVSRVYFLQFRHIFRHFFVDVSCVMHGWGTCHVSSLQVGGGKQMRQISKAQFILLQLLVYLFAMSL